MKHEYGGVGGISQWQREIVHFFLIVDDDGIRAKGSNRQRVYRTPFFSCVEMQRHSPAESSDAVNSS